MANESAALASIVQFKCEKEIEQKHSRFLDSYQVRLDYGVITSHV